MLFRSKTLHNFVFKSLNMEFEITDKLNREDEKIIYDGLFEYNLPKMNYVKPKCAFTVILTTQVPILPSCVVKINTF